MSIEEAIEHCEEVVTHSCEKGCAENHKQLANWLRELCVLRKILGITIYE